MKINEMYVYDGDKVYPAKTVFPDKRKLTDKYCLGEGFKNSEVLVNHGLPPNFDEAILFIGKELWAGRPLFTDVNDADNR